MPKQFKTHNEARQSIKNGIDKVANIVKLSYGPMGHDIILDKGFGSPIITNDGVTIAKEIELEDKFENIGAELVKEVASTTNNNAGDGTSTAIVLTQAMVAEGIRNILAGNNPIAIKAGMKKAVVATVKGLKSISRPVKTKLEKAQIATISSLDENIGNKIADVMEEVGEDGVITIEESQTTGLTKEVVKGMRFDRGYLSPYMVTDKVKMKAVSDDPYIFVTDYKITSIADILPLLKDLTEEGKKDLVIIADDISGDALSTLVFNRINNDFNALCIKAPGYAESRGEMLQDIADLTGAKLISEKAGMKLSDTTIDNLGKSYKVIATKDTTTIIDGIGDTTDRIKQIKAELKQSTDDFAKTRLTERLSRMSGRVAVLRVGAATETEAIEQKYKVEDALNATKAAVKEGIIPGGGASFLKVAKNIHQWIDTKNLSDAEMIGVNIICKALESPFRTIAGNANMFDVSKIIESVEDVDKSSIGYDFKKSNMVDLIKEGIIDPLKVSRCALENSASIVSVLLTTEAIITDIKEDD